MQFLASGSGHTLMNLLLRPKQLENQPVSHLNERGWGPSLAKQPADIPPAAGPVPSAPGM